MLEREKEIEEIEAEMIADGKTPQDSDDLYNKMREEDIERQVVNIMLEKYYRIIEFN